MSHPSFIPDPRCRIGRITFKRRASSRILTEFNVTTNRLRSSLTAQGKYVPARFREAGE